MGVYHPTRLAMDQTGMGEKLVEDAICLTARTGWRAC